MNEELMLSRIQSAVAAALAEYRCQFTHSNLGDGLALADALTPPHQADISFGKAELALLEDAIVGKIEDAI